MTQDAKTRTVAEIRERLSQARRYVEYARSVADIQRHTQILCPSKPVQDMAAAMVTIEGLTEMAGHIAADVDERLRALQIAGGGEESAGQ